MRGIIKVTPLIEGRARPGYCQRRVPVSGLVWQHDGTAVDGSSLWFTPDPGSGFRVSESPEEIDALYEAATSAPPLEQAIEEPPQRVVLFKLGRLSCGWGRRGAS